MEYFYASIICEGIVTEKNYKNILEQLKKIEFVVVPKKRDIHGATLGYQISINPDIEESEDFTKDQFMQLCISHELGHVINNNWKKDSKKLSKELYNNPDIFELFEKLDINDYRYLSFGFDLLDEVVAEEVAERVTYRLARKKRNKKINKNKLIVYNELYEYALEFSKSLDYIRDTKNVSNDEVMLKLVRRSFDEEFINNIFNEINNSDVEKREKLITMLVCMGKIKASTYEVIGLNKNSEEKIDDYKDLFREVIRRK